MNCVLSYVTRTAILLKPYVSGVQIVKFRSQEICYHRSIATSVDGDGLACIISMHFRRWSIQHKIHTKQLLAWVSVFPNPNLILSSQNFSHSQRCFFHQNSNNFQLLQSRIREHTTWHCEWSFYFEPSHNEKFVMLL